MSKQERKKEILSGKFGLLVMLFSVLIGVYYFNYDFNDYLYNGLVTLVLSVLIYNILRNNAYYIETGKHPTTKNEEEFERFQLFNRMHPFIALYDKLLAIIFAISLVVSTVMIISSFF